MAAGEESNFEFECNAKAEEGMQVIEDKLKFKIRPDRGGLVVSVMLQQEMENETMESETETGFDVRFDKLIEYRKQTASGVMTARSASSEAYEFGVDEIVQEWDLDEWTDMSGVTVEGDLLKFSATALGIANFGFTIAQTYTGAISANRMKIDFTLDGYEWTGDDTYLALISHVETENEVDVKQSPMAGAEEEEDEEAETEEVEGAAAEQETEMAMAEGDGNEATIDFSRVSNLLGYSAFGTYSWVPTAESTKATNTTDGRFLEVTETIPVVATTAPGGVGMSKQDIAFSFIGAGRGADKIYWDPEAGVGYRVEGSAAGVSSASGVWIGTTVTMVAMALSTFLF
jgi:hypothetical protein